MGLKEEILAHHQFRFQQLSPGNGSNEQPFVRFLIFIKKRPDISDEKFHLWWKTVHADLAVAVAGFGGHCSRYVQVGSTTELISHKKDMITREQQELDAKYQTDKANPTI